MENKVKNIPNFTELNQALNAYFSSDKELIEDNISSVYSSLSGQISMLPLRFFHRFINEKASLFSNSFERQLYIKSTNIDLDFDELTLVESFTERYHHLFQASATQINFDGKRVSFIALDATMYFHDIYNDVWYLRYNDQTIYAYVKENVQATLATESDEVLTSEVNLNISSTSKVIVYKNAVPNAFEYNLEVIDYNKSWEDNGFIRVANIEPLDDFPFVEWRSPRIRKPIPHELAKLQRDYITMLSWGFFNVSPKLLNQIIVKTGMNADELQEVLQNVGSSTSALKLGLNDELNVFDTGNITVLKDLFDIYSAILEQASLHEGVDKNAIVSKLRVESGEAKKVELGYINKARNNFKAPARLYEKSLVKVLRNVYKIELEYNGIVFHDLALASEPVNDLEYATAMYVNHFWTYEQAYAYVNKVTVETANILIEELGLTPPISMEEQGMRTQVNDTALKNGFQRTQVGDKTPKIVGSK